MIRIPRMCLGNSKNTFPIKAKTLPRAKGEFSTKLVWLIFPATVGEKLIYTIAWEEP